MMQIVDITNELRRKSNNWKRMKTTTIVLHYDGIDYGYGGKKLCEVIAKNSAVSGEKWRKTIPYHVRICKDGTIYKCLDWNDYTFHCHNDGISKQSIAICIEHLGYTDKQRESVRELVSFLRNKYGKNLTVKGHRDVSYKYTSCPGDLVLADIDNLNTVLGASTIMESVYKQGDIIEVIEKLGVKLRESPSKSAVNKSTQTKGERLEVLSGEVVEADGYKWQNVRANEGDGWVAVQFTKLFKSAEVVQAQDAKYHAEEIKKHCEEIIKLSK